MVKEVQKYHCQNCDRIFNIKRGWKILSLPELKKWLKIARCPYCGKKIR